MTIEPDPRTEIDPEGVSQELIDRVVHGDASALAELFSIYRPRLWRMVNFRLHGSLQGRIDPDDVLQDAYLSAVDRISHFLSAATSSPFIWFRMIVNQTLIELHRKHIGAEKRSANRERSINSGPAVDSTSSSLAFHLMAQIPSPSSAVQKVELARQLEVALQGMNDIDREVLTLRHFEELSNSETARVLGMSEQAASARYVRALKRLKQILELIPDLAANLRPS